MLAHLNGFDVKSVGEVVGMGSGDMAEADKGRGSYDMAQCAPYYSTGNPDPNDKGGLRPGGQSSHPMIIDELGEMGEGEDWIGGDGSSDGDDDDNNHHNDHHGQFSTTQTTTTSIPIPGHLNCGSAFKRLVGENGEAVSSAITLHAQKVSGAKWVSFNCTHVKCPINAPCAHDLDCIYGTCEDGRCYFLDRVDDENGGYRLPEPRINDIVMANGIIGSRVAISTPLFIIMSALFGLVWA